MTQRSQESFDRLAILGMGMLGGSVALAARARGLAGHVVAASRTQSRLKQALARGVVDEIGSVAEAVQEADLVVLGSPVEAMPGLMAEAGPHLAPGALITDVGSVKGGITEKLAGMAPAGTVYIGAHPMAGSHLQGALHAREDLFDAAVCILTPLASTPTSALARMEAFWGGLGATVVHRDPLDHDAEVAWISHVPHALAFAFARALGSSPQGAGVLAGSGFRDFTRIAQSDARMWSGILVANRKELQAPLQDFRKALDELTDAIDRGDGDAVVEIIDRAKENLEAISQAHSVPGEEPLQSAMSGGENPEG